ncbi:hypothetical protein [Methylophaga thalassica]|uniref:hypothetical protein n=1 Tax=Methylophaga thalassica TaxID=40223 RepID=UPI002E7B25C2|nr:hypothetical protein [Methylophaga thalassica]WVI86682.1 hypothetical protein VSX76_08720 [Methylophaga thalassica]
MLNKYRYTFLMLFICLGLACFPVTLSTDHQIKQMMAVTLSVYAIARGLNGVISVAQGTEVSIEPMGVGLTLAPGQILDPLNDLIEQFSTILLTASASLGIQQIILFLSDQWGFRVGIIVLVLIAAIATLSSMVGGKQKRILLKTVLFLSVLRLLIPVSVMFSGTLQGLMQSQRDEAVMVLQTTQNEVETLTNREQEQPKGWFDSLKGKLDIESKLQQIRQQADRAVHAAVYLLAEFVLLMLLMPLLTLWLLSKLTKALIK